VTSLTSNRFLYLFVFIVGTGTLGAEIAATRLMAPFFGASTIVWANTIGVVLIALSLGYWLGGRLADRYPHVRGMCLVVLIAAILLAVVPFVARPLFDVSVEALDEIQAGAFIGSLFGVLFLIALPVLLLGAVAPYAIRLAVPDVQHSGRVAGRLYAISTAGSLLGNWLSALLLIPLLGTQRTFVAWVQASTLTSNHSPIGSADAGGSGSWSNVPFTVRVNASGSEVQVRMNGSTIVSHPGAWPGTGQWVMIAVVLDQVTGQVRTYVNGRAYSGSTSWSWSNAPGHVFWIGRSAGSGAWYGPIGQVAILEYGLTANQVCTLWQAGSGKDC